MKTATVLQKIRELKINMFCVLLKNKGAKALEIIRLQRQLIKEAESEKPNIILLGSLNMQICIVQSQPEPKFGK